MKNFQIIDIIINKMHFQAVFRKEKIQDVYLIDQNPLGHGAFGVVKKAYSKKDNQPFAIKIYEKSQMDNQDEVSLENQINIMSQINHPNIVKLFQVYEDKTKWYLVMELMTGGQLFDRIVQKDRYSQTEAKEVILPVIDAIRYLHQMGIVHRDLKPENLLYDSTKSNAVIKISDFGVSKIIKNERMSTTVGTPSYFAPQILVGNGYNSTVDYWSLGVILYILLCGYPPFSQESNQVLYEKIKRGQFEFPEQDWKEISPSAKDLLKNLLVVNSSQRYKAQQILNHDWIKNQHTSTVHLSSTYGNIKQYNIERKMKRAKLALQFLNRINNSLGK